MNSSKKSFFPPWLDGARFSANLYGVTIEGWFPTEERHIRGCWKNQPLMRIELPEEIAGLFGTTAQIKVGVRYVTAIQIALVADITKHGLPTWQNLSTNEMSNILGKSQSTVAQMCKSGAIPGALKVGRGWEVNRKEFIRRYMPELFQ